MCTLPSPECEKLPALPPRMSKNGRKDQPCSFPPARPKRASVEFVDIQEILRLAKVIEEKKATSGVFPGPIFNEYTPQPTNESRLSHRPAETVLLPRKIHTPSKFQRITMHGYRVVRRMSSTLLSCICVAEADSKNTMGYTDLENSN
ncbi:unnamed protein product, partial [Mesorhabditis spiculigera]